MNLVNKGYCANGNIALIERGNIINSNCSTVRCQIKVHNWDLN